MSVPYIVAIVVFALIFAFLFLALVSMEVTYGYTRKLTEAEVIALVRAHLRSVFFVNPKVLPSQCAAGYRSKSWWHAEWSAKEKVWLVGRVPTPQSPVFKPGWRVYENTLIVKEIKGGSRHCFVGS